MTLKRSLLSRYMLIVLSAIMILPISLPVVSVVAFLQGGGKVADTEDSKLYRDGNRLESMWHMEAAKLGNRSPQQIDAALERKKTEYPKAELFWVDGSGHTRLQLPETGQLPDQWSASYTVQYMKQGVSADDFTIVAFIGGSQSEGFMVFKIPRVLMQSGAAEASKSIGPIFVIVVLIVLAIFLFISLLFFYGIRKRLVRLQAAMAIPAGNGIPAPVATNQPDEIGQLELAFNEMVGKLEASREREANEDGLRRDLIARLSHDLRTPLTAIRAHAFGLKQERLTEEGRQSLQLIDRKIEYVSQLIENLLSFTLLESGKYPYRSERIDIVRLARASIAGWYPAFEQQGYEIDINLPEAQIYWFVDPEWMERVLDNYFQNVLRHAKSGGYVALRISGEHGGRLTIADRGPGMAETSDERGAGIGLAIASLMLEEMGLFSEIVSGSEGTFIHIGTKS
ncbi:HAMP domain-containing sensor histidine kinase [Paenibacillus harenae]|uniref:HAMP domain-containing sensor histidine kinase n=1 Tax=Paenibacillus harenae TaxID=306543 RepID=UPI00279386DC|nr:HAMP domain-containing sensor histidine kinase [Paenibacillus harenae]MDQ0060683.1 signal transduction histidine kinase [Paenibacillus harenae]